MKILVLNAFEMSAATTIRMNQLARVLARKHRIVFVSFSEKGFMKEEKNIKYVVFKKLFSGPFYHFYQMILKMFVCLREDYDLIYVSKPLPWALFPGLFARIVKAKGLMLDWDEYEYAILKRVSRFSPYLEVMRFIEVWGVKSSDRLVVVSPFLENLAVSGGVERKRIVLVQNGVDIDNFRPRFSRGEMRKRFGLKGKVVMFVGALRPQFDIDIVIRAMPELIKKVPDAKLVIVGGGSFKEELEKISVKMGVSGSVRFLGPQPHELIPSIINAADVVVAPNRDNEMNLSRSPVKIAEYMAVGIPIVANAVGLAAEMLKEGAGELVYSDSPVEMARSIARLLKDNKRRDIVSKRARERVKRYYQWSKLGNKLERFIEKTRLSAPR